jgi:hypothetical protein
MIGSSLLDRAGENWRLHEFHCRQRRKTKYKTNLKKKKKQIWVSVSTTPLLPPESCLWRTPHFASHRQTLLFYVLSTCRCFFFLYNFSFSQVGGRWCYLHSFAITAGTRRMCKNFLPRGFPPRLLAAQQGKDQNVGWRLHLAVEVFALLLSTMVVHNGLEKKARFVRGIVGGRILIRKQYPCVYGVHELAPLRLPCHQMQCLPMLWAQAA